MKLLLHKILVIVFAGLAVTQINAQAGSECTACAHVQSQGYSADQYTVINTTDFLNSLNSFDNTNIVSITYDEARSFNLSNFQNASGAINNAEHYGLEILGFFGVNDERNRAFGWINQDEVIGLNNAVKNINDFNELNKSFQNEAEKLSSLAFSKTIPDICQSCNVFGPLQEGVTRPNEKPIVDLDLKTIPRFIFNDSNFQPSNRHENGDDKYNSGTADGVLETTTGLLGLSNKNVTDFGGLHDGQTPCEVSGDCQDDIKRAIELLETPIPEGWSREAIIDYEKKVIEVIDRLGQNENKFVAVAIGNARNNNLMSVVEHLYVAHNAQSILRTGEPHKFDLGKIITDKERESLIKDTSEIIAVDQNAGENSFWPQNAEEWKDLLALSEPVILEIGIAITPGVGEIKDLVDAFNGNSKTEQATAVAAAFIAMTPLDPIKDAVKSLRIVRKAIVVMHKVRKFRKAAAAAARKGFKTTVDSAGKLVVKKSGEVIALGDRGAKIFLERASSARGGRDILRRGRDRITGTPTIPIRNLDFTKTRFTEKGVDVVEKHLSRFDADGPNQIMVERLRKIAKGELEPTAHDHKFYTHELREFTRYRKGGHPEGLTSDDFYQTQHGATLEDFNIPDDPTELYHPSAQAHPEF